MSYIPRLFALGVLGCLGGLIACSGTASTDGAAWTDGGSTGLTNGSGVGSGTSSGGGVCVACLSDKDCGGGICSQFAGDTYCATPCSADSSCSPSESCTTLAASNGREVSVCVPRGATCGSGSTSSSSGSGGTASSGSSGGSTGAGSSGGGSTGSSGGGGGTCGGLAPPTTAAGCSSCSGSSSSCQANGCYGGWYCNTTTNKCQAAPSGGCGGGSSGGGSSSGSGSGSGTGSSSGGVDAGPPPTGTVGTTGGTVSRLYFSVVGDTRPANVDDTSGYPTAVITKIFQDMAGMNPPPSFGVSTGDYMFATPGKGNAQPQLNLYEGARNAFPNVMFPAMGNHECNGYTASNCGSGNTDGVTENLTAFLSTMLAPIGQTDPYYSINIDGTGNAWTAKFVFIAANAWDSAQSSWLDTTLAQATTYTFIVRHEAASANTAPGVTPSETIMAKHPYTLAIVGHTHTYEKSGAKEVIFGNGGAPLTGSGNYGFGLVQQLSSGVIQVDMIDYSTMQPDSKFEFRVNPDGSAAP